MAKLHVLVVGAGIGGLTAALALRRVGVGVSVFERADEIREVGAGISLQCNAVKVLRGLGLGEALERASATIQQTFLATWRGRRLAAMPFEEIARAAGAPAYGIHRGALQAALLEACGRDAVHVARRVTGYVLEGGRVAVEIEGGRRAEGDVLVGADGIRSTVRAQLLRDGEPRYSGYTCWRGVTEKGDLVAQGLALEMWGPGARLGGVALGNGQFYWFAPVNAPPGGRDEPGRTKAALLERFSSWAPPIPQAIEDTPEARIFRADIIDRPFSEKWGEGPVTLLGDAAHPMTPNLGQGACQAIEDAFVLARCLGAGGDLVAALRRYEDLRRERTRRMVELSWTFGRIAQWENGLARFLRDTAVAWTPRSRKIKDVLWAQTFPDADVPLPAKA